MIEISQHFQIVNSRGYKTYVVVPSIYFIISITIIETFSDDLIYKIYKMTVKECLMSDLTSQQQ